MGKLTSMRDIGNMFELTGGVVCSSAHYYSPGDSFTWDEAVGVDEQAMLVAEAVCKADSQRRIHEERWRITIENGRAAAFELCNSSKGTKSSSTDRGKIGSTRKHGNTAVNMTLPSEAAQASCGPPVHQDVVDASRAASQKLMPCTKPLVDAAAERNADACDVACDVQSVSMLAPDAPTPKDQKATLVALQGAASSEFQSRMHIAGLSGNALARLKRSEFEVIWRAFCTDEAPNLSTERLASVVTPVATKQQKIGKAPRK
jgi:hypothetical protein